MEPKRNIIKNKVFSLIAVLGLSGCLMLTSGCAAMMAAKQPPYTDTSILQKGVKRSEIRAAFGQPIYQEKDENGNLVETYQFKQGYRTGTKVVRVVFHIAADVFTVFLWEVVGMPMEMVFNGNKNTVHATFDDRNQLVEHIHLEK